ncbi:MAG TPA: TolC family protein [Candidatus Binataceae bacterium]|nr:TolC family protein [Candidatus Binataceae bacterium]
MPTLRAIVAIAIAGAIAGALTPAARAEQLLTESQLANMAIAANPQIKAARAQWVSALHQIKQTLAPNDPAFTFINSDSPKNPVGRASLQTFSVSQAFQFPGKAFFQRDQAVRTAETAHLLLESTIRDLRAGVGMAYYQLLLDSALSVVNEENIENLSRVEKVAEIANAGGQVTQTDVISADFDLSAARQLQMQYRAGIANDEAALNQFLYRPPGEPLAIDRTLKLKPLATAVDTLIDRANTARQEILEAALAQRNSDTAITLAKMEYLPDFTVGVGIDNYLVANFAPRPSQPTDWITTVGFNVPVFFWMKQNEDVAKAKSDLEAARENLDSIRSQTAATVSTIYRTAQMAYESAMLYRDSLTPLSRQDFSVALVAYQSGKIDFTTLSGVLQRHYNARVSFLQFANQFLAGRVALEQAIGAPLPQ